MPVARENENADALNASLSTSVLYSVTGKVIVISGGGSGIGAMLASGFAQNGSKVYIFSRKDASAFAADVTKKGPGSCTALQADLQNEEQVAAAVQLIEKREGKVDCLINNAGTNFNAPLEETPPQMFDKVLKVNVTGIFRAVKLFQPLLLKATQTARIINISSINGMDPPVSMDTYAYSSSKAAVIMLSRHLAARLAPAILVNALCPGPFRSRMMRGVLEGAGEEMTRNTTVLRRIGTPGDIVGPALLLASDAVAFVTGAHLPVDGGALLNRSAL